MKMFTTLRISVMDELPVVMNYTIEIINTLLLQLASLYFGPFKQKASGLPDDLWRICRVSDSNFPPDDSQQIPELSCI